MKGEQIMFNNNDNPALKIEYIFVDALTPYAKNTRKHGKEDVAEIVKSIEKYGFDDPIGIWSDHNIIVEGHGRLIAAKKLGMKEVPCIRLDHLTDKERREYAIMHNKTAELSEWDMVMLTDELTDLDISDFDVTFDGKDVDTLTAKEEAIVEDIPPEIDDAETTSKLGDVYKLGRHRLIVGDSTDPNVILKLMDGRKADMCVTDPPYNVNYQGGTKDKLKIQNDNMLETQFLEFLSNAFKSMEQVMKPGAAFYIWHADSSRNLFEKGMNSAGLYLRQVIIWVKNAFVIGRQDYQWMHEPCLYGWKEGAAHFFVNDRKLSTIIEDPDIDIHSMKKDELVSLLETILSEDVPTDVIHEDKPTRNDIHPTMKPVRLIARQIRNSSRKGEAVLDIFGGSGTTMIACEQLDRDCYMCELDPRYADAIITRWENLTGAKAEKINQ